MTLQVDLSTALAAFAVLFGAACAAFARADNRLISLLAVIACALALLGDLLAPLGLLTLAAGAALAIGATSPCLGPWQRTTATWTLAAFAVALGLHLLPGFGAWTVAEGFGRTAAGSIAWSFDKAYAGLLLVWLHQQRTPPSTPPTLRFLAAGILLGTVAVLALGMAVGIASFDPRLLAGLGWWVVGNVFISVAAEEAFFRGMIQRSLQDRFGRGSAAIVLAVLLTAILFGAAHAPWGLGFATLAGVAGVYYGVMYAHRDSLGPAIAAHACVNAAVVVLLSSPLA